MTVPAAPDGGHTWPSVLGRLIRGESLDTADTAWAMGEVMSGQATPAQLAVGLTPGLLVPDRAADAAVDVLRMADLARLRRCPPAAGGCGWVFLDHSRNGSRRWCSMDECGIQMKHARFVERRRRVSRA